MRVLWGSKRARRVAADGAGRVALRQVLGALRVRGGGRAVTFAEVAEYAGESTVGGRVVRGADLRTARCRSSR